MKKCRFCAEEIQDEAIKCRYCGQMLSEPQKWYFKTWALVMGLVSVGPFALPMVWFNPRYSKKVKIVITVIVLILTILIVYLFVDAVNKIMRYYKELSAVV